MTLTKDNASPSQSGIDRQKVEELADIIMVLQRCFMLNLSRELAAGQVSFAQYFLLGFISNQSALSMSEIAQKMNHTTAAATGMVDRLEKLGYVTRSHADNDRRKVMVQITQKGACLVAHIREDIIGGLSKLMDLLPQDDRDAWLRIYRKIHHYCTQSSS